jgi:hypothetical protein
MLGAIIACVAPAILGVWSAIRIIRRVLTSIDDNPDNTLCPELRVPYATSPVPVVVFWSTAGHVLFPIISYVVNNPVAFYRGLSPADPAFSVAGITMA